MVFGNVLDRKQGFLDDKNALNFFKGDLAEISFISARSRLSRRNTVKFRK